MTDRQLSLNAVIAAIEGLTPDAKRPDGVAQFATITIADAIAAVTALPDAWRPIKESDGSLCQVTDGGYIITAFKQDGLWVSGWLSDDVSLLIKLEPTHFMPLPSPPIE